MDMMKGAMSRSKGAPMMKKLFGRARSTAPDAGTHEASAEEQLLRVLIQDYCHQQHVRLKDMMEMMERQIIYLVLEESGGNQRTAARMLGVKPNTLHYKIHRMGLVPVQKYVMVEDLAGGGEELGPRGGH